MADTAPVYNGLPLRSSVTENASNYPALAPPDLLGSISLKATDKAFPPSGFVPSSSVMLSSGLLYPQVYPKFTSQENTHLLATVHRIPGAMPRAQADSLPAANIIKDNNPHSVPSHAQDGITMWRPY